MGIPPDSWKRSASFRRNAAGGFYEGFANQEDFPNSFLNRANRFVSVPSTKPRPLQRNAWAAAPLSFKRFASASSSRNFAASLRRCGEADSATTSRPLHGHKPEAQPADTNLASSSCVALDGVFS